MSDSGDGSVDYKREQRLAALEEKKRKLAEARAKNASLTKAVASNPGTAPSTPVKQLEGAGSSWNDIVATIEALPISASATPVKQMSSHAEGQEGPSGVTGAVKKVLKPLTISLGFGMVDIPPKQEVQMYSKGTQTKYTYAHPRSNADGVEEGRREMSEAEEVENLNVISEPVEPVNTLPEPQELAQQPAEIINKVLPVATIMSEEEKAAAIKTSDFQKFLSHSSLIMDRALLLSEKYDLLEGRYDSLEVAPKFARVAANEIERVLSLFDKDYSADQQFNDIDWNPFEKSKVMCASYDKDGGSGSAILEFNLDYDGKLENRLSHTSSRITSAKYWSTADNTYNTSAGGGRLIIGGSYTGKIVLWDTRASGNRAPILTVSNSNTSAASSLSSGISPHKHPIYSLQVIDSRHFASVDTLGTLAVWDIYKMAHPVEELSLTWIKTGFGLDSSMGMNNALGMNSASMSAAGTNTGSKDALALKPESGTSNEVAVTGITFRDENSFYVASEDGSLFSGQRHGDRKGLLQAYRGHQATLSSVKIHPLSTSLPPHVSQNLTTSSSQPNLLKYNMNDLVLTSSLDWSVSLWHPKLSHRPLATFSDFADYVMDVAWSLHHPAVFAAADSAGVLSIWNLNSEEKEIAMAMNIDAAPHALNKVIWSPHQPDLLVAASHSSHLHVYKADSDLVTPAGDEWNKLEHTITDYHQQILQTERDEIGDSSSFIGSSSGKD